MSRTPAEEGGAHWPQHAARLALVKSVWRSTRAPLQAALSQSPPEDGRSSQRGVGHPAWAQSNLGEPHLPTRGRLVRGAADVTVRNVRASRSFPPFALAWQVARRQAARVDDREFARVGRQARNRHRDQRRGQLRPPPVGRHEPSAIPVSAARSPAGPRPTAHRPRTSPRRAGSPRGAAGRGFRRR